MSARDRTFFATSALLFIASAAGTVAWCGGRCRDGSDCEHMQSSVAGAWRHGLRLGLRRALCCAGFTMILLAIGVMNLAAMAVVAAGITLERFLPAPRQIAARPESW